MHGLISALLSMLLAGGIFLTLGGPYRLSKRPARIIRRTSGVLIALVAYTLLWPDGSFTHRLYHVEQTEMLRGAEQELGQIILTDDCYTKEREMLIHKLEGLIILDATKRREHNSEVYGTYWAARRLTSYLQSRARQIL